ncbi:hypothetical protein FXO37_16793 [Capsicum annuum]|nr:hypothetical protein FXO37_16793 [Capsicum annuum]
MSTTAASDNVDLNLSLGAAAATLHHNSPSASALAAAASRSHRSLFSNIPRICSESVSFSGNPLASSTFLFAPYESRSAKKSSILYVLYRST